MEENYKDEMIVIDNVNRYNEIFGLETKHPLVSIIDLTKSTTWPTRAWFRYEVYALFLKNVKCGDIKYGRQYYDYQDGTIVCFGPGQITDLELIQNIQGSVVILGGLSLVNSLHAYTFASLKRKKLISTTPLNDALNALILALNASAAAFVLLFTKKFRILS